MAPCGLIARGWLVALLLLVATAGPASALSETYAAAWSMFYRPGARELALGGAGTASAKGASAGRYNPALLSWQAGVNGGSYHFASDVTYYGIVENRNFYDLRFLSFPLLYNAGRWGQVGVDVTYVGDDKELYRGEDGSIVGSHRTYLVVAGLSYASRIGSHFSAGIAAKWFRDYPTVFGGSDEHNPVASGYAFDVGAVYRVSPRLMFGAALRDYGASVWYTRGSRAAPLPLNFDVGAMWRAIEYRRNTITLVSDLYKPLVPMSGERWYLAPIRGWYDESAHEELRQTDVHLGAEYGWQERVFARVGWYRDWDGGREWFTYGAGLKLPVHGVALVVDYGYTYSLLSAPDPNGWQGLYSLGVVF